MLPLNVDSTLDLRTSGVFIFKGHYPHGLGMDYQMAAAFIAI